MNKLINIKEIIVVEGRDDEVAIKNAVNAEIIITHGFGIKESTFKRIEEANKRCGVIIFTDPDFAGEQIRKRITSRIGNSKHAFLSKEDALKNGDIGIENASSESIIEALSKVRTLKKSLRKEFSMKDLIINGLSGFDNSLEKRNRIGKILGIGYGNSKQFLSRLNNYNISREEFNNALKREESENIDE